MCSETATPRVSFSNDLGPAQDQDQSPMDQKGSRRDDKLLPDSSTHPSPDFEFRFVSDLVQESSSADELFSNGMILPFHSKTVPIPDSEPPNVNSNSNPDPPATCAEAQSKKSFWGGFKRSASLNSEKKKGLIFHLPLLSRSNSTGSVPNQKAKPRREMNKGPQKHSSASSRSYQFPQKPPLKKNSNVHGGSYGNGNVNGVRVSPVLNVSPNLLGFGSFLRNGKDKKMKK